MFWLKIFGGCHPCSRATSATLHSSKHTQDIWWHPTVFQLWGRASKRSYNTRHSFCSWSYSLDSYLVHTSHPCICCHRMDLCWPMCVQGFCQPFQWSWLETLPSLRPSFQPPSLASVSSTANQGLERWKCRTSRNLQASSCSSSSSPANEQIPSSLWRSKKR